MRSFFHFSGKPAEQWLRERPNDVDLRERLVILQQVVNTLAAIHIGGHEDHLSLYGAFIGRLLESWLSRKYSACKYEKCVGFLKEGNGCLLNPQSPDCLP